jgi:hypothetical protein
MRLSLIFAGVAVAAVTASAAQAGILVTYEAPGVTNTTATFDVLGTENFNTRALGVGGFATNFGGNGVISGQYSSTTQVNPGDQYGGQGGSNYAVTFGEGGYSLDITSTQNAAGVTYFGYYLPALDQGNVLELYSGATKIFTFNPTTVLSAVSGNPLYFGKPDAPHQGQNGGEPYVFVNFYGTAGTHFDRVVFRETPAGGGYESDNHTVGYFKTITGTGVPEPATWAMMIIGFGGVGAMVRRSRQRQALLA